MCKSGLGSTATIRARSVARAEDNWTNDDLSVSSTGHPFPGGMWQFEVHLFSSDKLVLRIMVGSDVRGFGVGGWLWYIILIVVFSFCGPVR